ncbi:alkaline phosphatase [Thiohalocapsa sp. ML1]|uniref:alkaline phosphatase n=1 Tax=Thiohalocapsa sp. ML1 TaxID=1431688 RepID=UPI0007322233|nr:alkaline phosphatase [Thiohalocapsa sp. ML1]
MQSTTFHRGWATACASALLFAALSAEAGPAKNVILMITDGASWGTWDMASYYEYGELGRQPYDSFPVKLGMTTTPLNTSSSPTFNATPQVDYDPYQAWDDTPTGGGDHFAGYTYLKKDYTDSAAAGTALATGQKTYNNAINFDNFGQPLEFISQIAKDLGKSTGAVSSVPFSHATPATFGAQNSSRNHYGEISRQMVNGGDLDLIMGGGNPLYDGDGIARTTPAYANETGTGGGYIAKSVWDSLTDGSAGWQFVQDKADFDALADGTLALTGQPFIGVPKVSGTLQYGRTEAVQGSDLSTPSRVAFNPNVPTLETMTRGALNYLGQDPDGLFVMIEGGAVDWAAHGRDTAGIIEEQMDFNAAVKAATDWVEDNSNWMETLLIVLTDHGNAMPMGPDSDDYPFQAIQNNGQGNLPGVQWHYGTHTNENTLFFAKGAGSDLFYDHVLGFDPYLASVLGFNDGRYIENSAVFGVMRDAMVPVPGSLLLVVAGLPLLAARLRGAAARV